ncbi:MULTISPECIES: glucosaminidase domain-containing protein [unclassified Agarivorans]|uniref:glucosaminidase domain-containing protein n=1 Tax=unclassified Agarivorans TaxID=2636026 RepID=UPI003D7E7DE4
MKNKILTALLLCALVGCDKTPQQDPSAFAKAKLPNFQSISDVTEKKQAFTDFILPLVDVNNQQLRELRQQLIGYQESASNHKLNKTKLKRVEQLAKTYRVAFDSDINRVLQQLLMKVDVIPSALVLAQAANESAWGTSRFAREGNNLFGQWCYTKGCGLVPLSRVSGASHEVRKFTSVYQSVSAYMLNLNSNPAYSDFQQYRQQARQTGALNAIDLASHLTNYSERGEAYVEELKKMIQINQKLWPSSIAVTSS